MVAVAQETRSHSRIPSPSISRDAQRRRSLARACQAARVLEELRGQETLVLDLTAITPITDYFVITTGTSPRQMRSSAEEVRLSLKGQGSRPIGTEGDSNSTWILQDYGDLVVHIFTADARKLYDLEHLWGDAPRIDWKTQSAS